MALKTDAEGKSWPSTTYQVGREKIKEYATVLGIENPVHFDVGAARDAGFRDVVAPPMFAVVYAMPSLAPAMFDPEVEINFAKLVHGGQTFEWNEPACSGTRSRPPRNASRSRRNSATGSTSSRPSR